MNDRLKYALDVLCEHPGRDVDWNRIDPVTFLQTLEKCDRNFVTFWNYPPNGWMKPNQVEWLKKQVDSDKPCASFVSALSSKIPTEKITVGLAARALLEQFGTGKSPVLVDSPQKPKPAGESN